MHAIEREANVELGGGREDVLEIGAEHEQHSFLLDSPHHPFVLVVLCSWQPRIYLE